MSKVWEYLGEHKVFFTILLLTVGFFECFFGYRSLKPTLFIVGCFSGFGLLVAVLGEFVIGPDTETVVVWVVLLITMLFGILLGYLTMSVKRIGIFCLGFWLGTALAFLLNNAVLHKLEKDYVIWVSILVLGSLGGIGSFIFHRHVVILATSFVGAYAIVRPFGWIADGFPNEFTLVE